MRTHFPALITTIAAACAALAGGPAAAGTQSTCSTSTVSNNGLVEIRLGSTVGDGTPCINSAGSAASNELGHQVGASSQAEPGRLRGFANAAGAPPANTGLTVAASSGSFFSESGILVGGLPASGAQLNFQVRWHGTLDSDTTDVPFPFNTAVTAFSQFRATLINEVSSNFASTLQQACVNNPNSSVSTCNIPGGSAGRSTEVTVIVPMSVYANNGDTLFLSLGLDTSVFGFTPRGNFVQARADFNHTVEWLGVVPGPDVAGLTLTAGTGFDYVQGFASAVPEPSAWAMWMAGLCVAGAVSRRQRVGTA